MISINDLQKIVKKGDTVVHTLKGITLNIEQGQIFGVVGRKGAGKSSLIRSINLLDPPSSGAVTVDSCVLTTLSTEELRRARRNIGMIFQHINLLNSRTVFENIALPLEVSRAPSHTIESLVTPLLALTGLADKAHLYPNDLTMGQKQKVAIARALVLQPKVLLCDEATYGLDHKAKHSVLQLLSEINQKLNLTILLITHEIDVIKAICDRAAVLHQGEIIEEGTVLELFSHPKAEITRDFIRSEARSDLPTVLKNRLQAQPHENLSPIVRITFADPTLEDPYIAEVIQTFSLSINIIQAHLEPIRGGRMGIIIAEMIGDNEDIQQAIQSLSEKDLHIEVLGYAPRNS